MTNAQSRFADTKIAELPFWMMNSLTSNGGRDQPDWRWIPSRQAFINKWGREVRCAAVTDTEKRALQQDIQRQNLTRITGQLAVASVPSVYREEAKALWREWTVEAEKKALRRL